MNSLDHSSEWQDGWSACRAVTEDEWAAWYQRGLDARSASGAAVGLGLCALSGAIVGFIIGFVACAAWFG